MGKRKKKYTMSYVSDRNNTVNKLVCRWHDLTCIKLTATVYFPLLPLPPIVSFSPHHHQNLPLTPTLARTFCNNTAPLHTHWLHIMRFLGTWYQAAVQHGCMITTHACNEYNIDTKVPFFTEFNTKKGHQYSQPLCHHTTTIDTQSEFAQEYNISSSKIQK